MKRQVARWSRFVVPVVLLGVAISLIWWRGPEWGDVRDAFTIVSWDWIVLAVVLNLFSVVVRARSWNTCVKQAMAPPWPRFRIVFSAFSVGLFANAVLPGRVGELARVAVLARRIPGRPGIWATLVGSVVAHRLFDIFPAVVLVIWVASEANLPHWAVTSTIAVLCGGAVLIGIAWAFARRHQRGTMESLGRVRALLVRVRAGFAVMGSRRAAATAGSFQFAGWTFQLLAVWAVMRGFDIDLPFVAAGLVLVLINIATIFPLWPGNVGLVQAAIATPLFTQYDVDYARGIAFGIGLQAVEACVGVGIGLLFLAREGLSYATLKDMPEATEVAESVEDAINEPNRDDDTSERIESRLSDELTIRD